MSITVGTLTISALREIPFTHSGDALTGRTARRFPVSCILTPAEWLTLNTIYTNWRTLRLADPDTMVSLSVGSTVTCSGTVHGMTWSNVATWFSDPPNPTQVGAMVGVTFELIDAAQQLAIMLREMEVGTQIEDNDQTLWGTYTVGGVVINLNAQPDTWEDLPTLELAASGTSFIRGTYGGSRIKQIDGWTQTANADATLRTWYEDQIDGSSTPAANTYWPISPPDVQRIPVIVNGARVTRFLVSITLKEVR
jgi:hypothetical protein